MNEQESASADQEQWSEFSSAIRAELGRRGEGMQQMNIGDLHSFVCCCRDALNVEIAAKSYDARLDRAQKVFGE